MFDPRALDSIHGKLNEQAEHFQAFEIWHFTMLAYGITRLNEQVAGSPFYDAYKSAVRSYLTNWVLSELSWHPEDFQISFVLPLHSL